MISSERMFSTAKLSVNITGHNINLVPSLQHFQWYAVLCNTTDDLFAKVHDVFPE